KNLDDESLSIEDLNTSEERKILADKLERSLGEKLPQIFSIKAEDFQRESHISSRKGSGSHTRVGVEVSSDGVEGRKRNLLPGIVAGSVLLVAVGLFVLRSIRS